MRYLISFFILCLAMTSIQAAPKQQDVKNYLEQYGKTLKRIKAQADISAVMTAGDATTLKNSQGLTHAIELIDAIVAGKLDTCCWDPSPTGLEGFANGTTTQLKARSVLNYGPQGQHQFTPTASTAADITTLESMLNRITNPSTRPKVTGIWANHGFDIMRELGTFFDDLVWGYSYLLSPELNPSFSHRYIYSCVVCFGAGFYDTSKLHTAVTSSGVTSYSPITGQPTGKNYADVVNTNNFPTTYAWLQGTFQQPTTTVAFLGNAQPIQTSIGPTLQGQPTSSQGKLTDSTVIYPGHCHYAEELYFALDPIGTIKSPLGSQTDRIAWQAAYPTQYAMDTATYVAATKTINNLPISFDTNMWPEFKRHHYQKIGSNSLLFNSPLDLHSMHPGEFLQLAQWARFTQPLEGTYFPINGGPNPPSNVRCIGKNGLTVPVWTQIYDY